MIWYLFSIFTDTVIIKFKIKILKEKGLKMIDLMRLLSVSFLLPWFMSRLDMQCMYNVHVKGMLEFEVCT